MSNGTVTRNESDPNASVPSFDRGSEARAPEISLSFVQMGKILMRYKWVAISVFTMVMAVAMIYVLFATPLYKGTATLDISTESGSSGSLSDLIQNKLSGEEADVKMQTEINIMQSQSVLVQVAKKLDLAHKSPFEKALKGNPVPEGSTNLTPSQEATIAALMMRKLKFALEPSTTILQVTYLSPDPQLARDVPNTIIDSYIGKDLGNGYQGTARVTEWLSEQLQDLRTRAQDAQQKLTDFQRKEGIIGVDETQNMLVEKVRLINEQVTSAEADRISKEALYRVAQTNNPELIGALIPNSQLQILRGQEMELRMQYNDARSRYGDNYPTVKQYKAQLDDIDVTINSEISKARQHFQLDYSAALKAEEGLRSNLDEQKRAVFAVDQNAADFAILRHDAESSRNLYDAIQYKLKETGLLDTLKSTQFRMVDEAQMPSQPAEPQRAVILLGTGLVGMFLGCMGALAVGFADDAVYSSDDLERITGRPVLGAIPRIQVSGSGKKASVANDQTPSTIILLKEPTSSGAEAFRGLRSSLLLSFVDKTPQIQVVTSAAQGEGKSLIAINYAASLAQRGAKVLVVDADLRRGMLHHRLGIPLTPGLTNLLSSLNEHVEEPQAPFPDLPNLSVLPRGPNPPNPVELLDSRKMTELLDRWRSKYDFIILDSAPLLPVADTFALASKSDMVLFIVRIGSTRRRSLVRMLQMLDRAKAPVGGLIINDVSRSLDEYAYYYGDYGYYHSDKKSSSR